MVNQGFRVVIFGMVSYTLVYMFSFYSELRYPVNEVWLETEIHQNTIHQLFEDSSNSSLNNNSYRDIKLLVNTSTVAKSVTILNTTIATNSSNFTKAMTTSSGENITVQNTIGMDNSVMPNSQPIPNQFKTWSSLTSKASQISPIGDKTEVQYGHIDLPSFMAKSNLTVRINASNLTSKPSMPSNTSIVVYTAPQNATDLRIVLYPNRSQNINYTSNLTASQSSLVTPSKIPTVVNTAVQQPRALEHPVFSSMSLNKSLISNNFDSNSTLNSMDSNKSAAALIYTLVQNITIPLGNGVSSSNFSDESSPTGSNFSNMTSNFTDPLIPRKPDLSPPGVLLVVRGRLGNQLFQYACSYALARKLNVSLYLYKPELSKDLASHRYSSERGFQLQYFNIKFHKLVDYETTFLSQDIYLFNDSQLLLGELPSPMNKILRHIDYCNSEKFFEPYGPEIIQMYEMRIEDTKPIQSWIDQIQNVGNRSVAVHVRRGDYIQDSRTGWMTPISFQRHAMDFMLEKFPRQNITFFVFSDDIQFAQKELAVMKNTLFVSSENISSLEEFYLMTKCSHMIVANSTFSWWAAYLIKYLAKVIIGPKFHPSFFDHYEDAYTRDFKRFVINHLWYPRSWIVLDPYEPKFR